MESEEIGTAEEPSQLEEGQEEQNDEETGDVGGM